MKEGMRTGVEKKIMGKGPSLFDTKLDSLTKVSNVLEKVKNAQN